MSANKGRHGHAAKYGHAAKSPRFRHGAKRDAEKNERKRVRIGRPASSLRELIKGKGKRS